MTTSNLAPKDAELIAAFIDRRLSDDERQAFLERLDSEEALYEVFVETVRYRDQTSARSASVSEHPAAMKKRSKWKLPAAVAALLALAVAPVLIRNLSEESYAEALVADGRMDPYLGNSWYLHRWSTMRGSELGIDEDAAGFRLGVLVVDLRIALLTGSRDQAQILTSDLKSILGDIPSSEPLRAWYTLLGNDIARGAETEQLLKLAKSNEKLLTDSLQGLESSFELGRWVEAGRLAARSENLELIRSRKFTKELERLRSQEWSDEVSESLARLGELIDRRAQDLDASLLEDVFVSIIGES